MTPRSSDFDPALAALLDQSVAPEALPKSMQRRIQNRLAKAIAGDSTQRHVTQFAAAGEWFAMSEQISFKVLNQQGGTASYLLKMQPGAILPAHHHPVDEECLVLEGELSIGEELVLHPGDFHLALKDLPHADIASRTGALLFLRGAIPHLAHLL
jgi:quercetin dioxygenase-like cupin family protein